MTATMITAIAVFLASITASWLVAGLRMRSLEQELHTDPLTGIGNRRAFEHAMRELDSESDRDYAVIMIDLDGFKDVNDSHGHPVGDETLKQAASLFESIVNERASGHGKVYRFGGDEFAVLLKHWTVEGAETLVEQMRQRAESEMHSQLHLIRISAGIAASPVHAERVDALVSLADRALFQAKRAGRNRTIAYAPHQLDPDAPADPLALLRILSGVLAAAVDAKDAYTHAHSHNVADLSGYLARTMGLSNAEVEEVFLAGLLHDVGKVGVADAVLSKPGRLDQDEWRQIQAHCEIGYRILNSIEGARQVRDMVLYHHERPDGTGYPTGIAGHQIPIGARIIGVADAFDSMTASRVYGTTKTTDEALAEIVRLRNQQFDTDVVDALCELMLYEPIEEAKERDGSNVSPIRAQRSDLRSVDADTDETDGLDVAA